MRQFYTRTGVSLTLLDGGGQGDGVPRGVLRVARDGETVPILENQFSNATVSIRAIGYSDTPTLCIRMRIDAKSAKRPNYVGGLVTDVSNWVYRTFNLGVHCPSIAGLKDRAKMGQKEIVFHYELSQHEAARLGFRGQYGECLILKRGA